MKKMFIILLLALNTMSVEV